MWHNMYLYMHYSIKKNPNSLFTQYRALAFYREENPKVLAKEL